MDFFLLIEHLARELDVAIILQNYLRERHGLTMEIGSVFRIPEAQAHFRPRFVLVPFCYYPPQTLPRWRKSGHFNLSWEQLFFRSFQQEKRPRGPISLEWIRHHSWGPFHTEFLRRQGVPREHIFQNGHLAHQLYRPPYRDFFLSREELSRRYSLDPDKKWVLFAENYAWAFYPERRIQELVREGLEQGVADDLRAYSMQCFDIAMRWCDQLAARGDIEVILRPRPALSQLAYEEAIQRALGGAARFRVIKDESVRDWILASQTVLSSYSTSLLEAAVAGKPAYSVQPKPLPDHLQMAWLDFASVISTSDELMAVCSQQADGKSQPLADWARENILGSSDPILDLADYLAQVSSGPTSSWEIPAQVWEAQQQAPSLVRRAKNLIRGGLKKLAGQPDKWRLSDEQLAKVDSLLTQDEMDRRREGWEKVLPTRLAHEPR